VLKKTRHAALMCGDIKTLKQREDHVATRLSSMTDLRISQIGHGLGPRATPSYDDSLLT